MFRPTNRIRTGALAVTATALMLSGCSSTDSGTGEDADTVSMTFRSDVYFNGALVPVVVGLEQGIFEDHGVNLTIQEGTGSSTTIQTVANGSDDIGFADAASVVQNRARGVEAKMFYNVIAESPLTIYTRAEDGISEAQELTGLTGGFTAGSAAEVLFPAYLKANNMTEEGIELVNVDIPTRGQLFLAGDTDFTFGLTNVTGPSISSSCDCELASLPYKDAGVNPLGSGFIVSDKYADENAEALRKFVTAYEASVEFVNEDPDRAADLFFARATESTVSKDVLTQQWEETYALKDREGQETADGCMTEEAWDETIRLVEEYGNAPAGNVEAADIMTNDAIEGGCT